jgi:hypothetical protein
VSRYHRFKQHDGKGYGILVIDEHDVTKATVLHANMTWDTAADHLDALRTGERLARGET